MGNIIDNWIHLGGYGVFDNDGRGYADVIFNVQVADNDAFFVSGVNTFNLVASVGGYVNGSLVTEPQTVFASVDVVFEER